MVLRLLVLQALIHLLMVKNLFHHSQTKSLVQTFENFIFQTCEATLGIGEQTIFHL